MVDFRDSESRRLEINQYVEKFTESNIKDLLPPGSVTEDTNVVLLNAAYFKGNWEETFNSAETETKIFNGANPTNVEMMHKESEYYYGISS